MSDYADILSKSWAEIPEVELLPDGSYLLKGQSAKYQPAKQEDQTPAVLFIYKPKEAMDDVSAEELAALGDNYDIASNRIFAKFFVNDGADWDKVRKHLIKHGIDANSMSIEESLKAFKNSEVVALLSARSFTNNAGETQTENQATNFTKVPE